MTRGANLTLGGGATVETATFSLAFPDYSPMIGALLAGIMLAFVVPIVRGRDPTPVVDRDSLADECRRLQRLLERFVETRRRAAPSSSPILRFLQFWRPGEDAWRAESERRYQLNLRVRATAAYDRLEEAELVPLGSRPLIERPSAEEIEHLPDLFANAARLLDRQP